MEIPSEPVAALRQIKRTSETIRDRATFGSELERMMHCAFLALHSNDGADKLTALATIAACLSFLIGTLFLAACFIIGILYLIIQVMSGGG